ncbi:MAG TPA: DUF2306 domain-containing protein [Pyrinomonadaceae bacterium]
MQNKIINGGLLTTMVLASVAIALTSFRYLSFEPIGLITDKAAELRSSALWLTAFYLHIGPGALALLVGGFQFIGKLRDKFTAVHRTVGKIYVVSVFVSATAGFGIAIFAEGGNVAKAGFVGLALAWFYTNYRAYTAIRRVEIAEHRAWMTRNFALTFAAVTLRIWLPLFLAGFGMKFNTAYPIIAWLCWVPNLLIAEFLVRRLKRPVIVSAQPEGAAA